MWLGHGHGVVCLLGFVLLWHVVVLAIGMASVDQDRCFGIGCLAECVDGQRLASR